MGTSMSLSDLASLGSFVSGFAVLISLIYLALQVRQAERNQQISIRHSRVSRTVELHLALADPAVAEAWLHGSESPQEISQTELSQFNNLCRALFFHFEDSFYQREERRIRSAKCVPEVRALFAYVSVRRSRWGRARREGHGRSGLRLGRRAG